MDEDLRLELRSKNDVTTFKGIIFDRENKLH